MDESTFGALRPVRGAGPLHPAIRAPSVSDAVPQVGTELGWADRFGAWKARWGIGRMTYRVEPGLYRIQLPTPDSPVLVTCNYKLTFDVLRSAMAGVDAWILVLDTKGVNVWCAAGKGTFGTDELARRVEAVGLPRFVAHRTLILPQLGASGVNAAEVARRSGFSVEWGPVRAADVPAFLAAGRVATAEMRRVRFTLRDRVVLIPVELVQSASTALPVLGVLFVMTLLGLARFERADFLGTAGAWLVGCAVAPALLPWVPGRAFAWKGALLGAAWTALWIVLNGGIGSGGVDALRAASWGLLFPAFSAFLTMNFTGTSTYTSFSGVLKEMRFAVPAIVVSSALGALCLIAGAFFGTSIGGPR